MKLNYLQLEYVPYERCIFVQNHQIRYVRSALLSYLKNIGIILDINPTGNVLCFPIGDPEYLDNYDPIIALDDNTVSEIIGGNIKIIFEVSNEGFTDCLFRMVHSYINKKGIKPSTVYVSSGAIDIYERYQTYCNDNDICEKINIISISYFQQLSKKFVFPELLSYEYRACKKDQIYLCFNRQPARQRLELLSILESHGLNEKSFVSCSDREVHHESYGNFIEQVNHNFIDNIAFQKGYPSFRKKLPLILDRELIYNHVEIESERCQTFDYYKNSYFSIVNESYYYPYNWNETGIVCDAIFPTEKIFKAILAKHPFIVLGRPGFLKCLKDLGFKTFSPYIDEMYDEIDDDELRLLAVSSEIITLSNKTSDEWVSWQKSIEDIVVYNYHKMFESEFVKINNNLVMKQEDGSLLS